MNYRDLKAFVNGVHSADMGLDAAGNPHFNNGSSRHWIRGWRLMRRVLEKQKAETTAKNKEE